MIKNTGNQRVVIINFIILTAIFILNILPANAQILKPFGGTITRIIPCTSGLLLEIGGSSGGSYAFGHISLANPFLLKNGACVLGVAAPLAGLACITYDPWGNKVFLGANGEVVQLGGSNTCSVDTTTLPQENLPTEITPPYNTVTGPSSVSSPVINSISPSEAAAGGANFDLTVSGSNFTSGSVVKWNDADKPTVYISTTELKTSISASDISNSGINLVSVVNPDGGASLISIFTVTAPGSTIPATGYPTTQPYIPAQPSTPATSTKGMTFPVNVTVISAVKVRSGPHTTSALSGTKYLVAGDVFVAVNKVVGDMVDGINEWWVTSKGNYVWSGATRVGGTVSSGPSGPYTVKDYPATISVTASSANVRSQPSASAPVVRTMTAGRTFTAITWALGDSISGQAKWWVTSDKYYVWVGATGQRP